ncbi:hypothetical protein Maes01_01559 [Microbulbifer aestuariivivens]|uniref:Retropepsin-like aspartic endopeptidase domain-containing protein n=1 Tax=Microbulbifer aestuariivivens TaxID=1908308 RepID=A0ABP9WPD2_9GAMM
MRTSPLVLLLLVPLLGGCGALHFPWQTSTQAGTGTPTENAASMDAPQQCPPVEEAVCTEPQVKIVERVIERTLEKVVEVPVAEDKLVLGSVEVVAIEPAGLLLESLIDTGAPTSSLSVSELTPFERDGKEWVRFKVAAGNDRGPVQNPVTLELPVKRYVRVARPGFGAQRRPVVMMSLTLGEVTHMVEVNLTDRSSLNYRLLVGRNYLKDAAVVDVSRRRVQGQPRPAQPNY